MTPFNKFAFLLLLGAVTLSFGCKEDSAPSLVDQLRGDWNVESYTEDGIEIINAGINSFTMEYEEYRDGEGDFTWSLTYSDGSSETITGEYEVDESDKEIELTNTDGEQIQLDIDLDGDDLELSGNIDGTAVIIKAERD